MKLLQWLQPKLIANITKAFQTSQLFTDMRSKTGFTHCNENFAFQIIFMRNIYFHNILMREN